MIRFFVSWNTVERPALNSDQVSELLLKPHWHCSAVVNCIQSTLSLLWATLTDYYGRTLTDYLLYTLQDKRGLCRVLDHVDVE